jgi:glycosyltransferase involved in cell wall biosynthesis
MRAVYITYMGLTEPLLYSQALSYIKGLSGKGISFYIVSFEKEEFLKKDNVKKIKKDLAGYGIKWFFLKYHKKIQFLSKPYDVIRGAFLVTYLTLKENINVIHARGAFSALIGIVPRLFLKRKMIFDMRGLMAEEYVDAGLWSRQSFIYRIMNKLEKYLIKKSDHVIVLTDKIKDIFLRAYKIKNMTIIPTCVNLEKFDLSSAKKQTDQFTLIYTGAIGTWYMLDEMIDFYKVLSESMTNARFIILSQSDKNIIERHVPKELRGSVVIKSADPEGVGNYLNTADMGIFFIKPCFSKIASCPTKFAEYLACGLPVIINSKIGDTDDIVRDNRAGIVIESFNIKEYAKAMADIKKLLEEGDILKRRCRDTAKRYFSLEEGVSKYCKIYDMLK